VLSYSLVATGAFWDSCWLRVGHRSFSTDWCLTRSYSGATACYARSLPLAFFERHARGREWRPPCQPKRLHSLITLKANLSRTSQIDQALTPHIWLSTADFDAPNSEQVIEYLAHHLPAYTLLNVSAYADELEMEAS
jgi:hypothetical protein